MLAARSSEITRVDGVCVGNFELASYGTARVVVLIAARNEARTIADAVSEALPFAHEVVVLDGRSTDGTGDIAKRAGATVYVDSGFGKGSAIRRSLELVEADILVMMDADGSHDPRDIPRLAVPVARGEVDLCVGSRFTGGSEELSVNVGQLVRTIGNISMNIAINKRWGVALSDTLNGFRAIRRSSSLVLGLRENRHTIEQEMVMKMLRHGYRVMNVPAHESSRKFGESHINIWREWPLFVWCVLRNVFVRDVRARAADRLTSDTVPASVPRGRNLGLPPQSTESGPVSATE